MLMLLHTISRSVCETQRKLDKGSDIPLDESRLSIIWTASIPLLAPGPAERRYWGLLHPFVEAASASSEESCCVIFYETVPIVKCRCEFLQGRSGRRLEL